MAAVLKREYLKNSISQGICFLRSGMVKWGKGDVSGLVRYFCWNDHERITSNAYV